MNNNKGVTITELLIVLVVLGIISAFSVVAVGNVLANTRLSADKQSISSLNIATEYYSFYNEGSPIFDTETSDETKIQLLFSEGFLDKYAITQSKDASFEWDEDNLVWMLIIGEETIALTSYGSTYLEITPNIISDIQSRLADTGSYGRSWGDYRYTDIGLDPDVWKNPIMHIYYTPSGGKLFLEPESGYEFTVYNSSGDEFFMKSSYNWNIIYNDADGLWYFNSVTSSKEIDINTLVVERS